MVLHNAKLGMYQRWLKDKFRKIETTYYNAVDELTQYIGDLDLPRVKPEDFTLTEFSFIKDWENGTITSGHVYYIMSKMDMEQAARAKILKRLQNYMIRYDELAQYIKPTLAELDKECVDEMVEYLDMMKKTFKKMADIDDTQMAVSWVQQVFKAGKPDELITEEMTLNQTIHHIDSFLVNDHQKFHLKDQVIAFHEEVGFDDHMVHWIFAPRQYIELIRVLFNIKEELGKEEIDYLKALIKEVE